MEVEIVSNECIKPCSSTPAHPKTYKISLFDQFIPPIYFSTAFFYQNTNPNFISQRSLVLKSSLSKTLCGFYPLAGKIKDAFSIDCNDEGAYYSEAKASISLAEFLAKPDSTFLKKLTPDAMGAFVVMVQETTFTCGGIAIGLSVSHMALDGNAFSYFVKAWALAASSGGQHIIYPNLDIPDLFPQYEGFPQGVSALAATYRFARKRKLGVRRLVFNASAINKLKSEAASIVENPSRVEVVSSFMSKTLMAALNVKSLAIFLSANMRQKAKPPIPNSSLGNLLWGVEFFVTEKESELRSIVYRARNAKTKLSENEVLNKAKKGGFLRLFEEVNKMGKEFSDIDGMEAIAISSWCNFGLYGNSNFGWGKPVWITQCSLVDSEEMVFCNMAILSDTTRGNGVEVLLYLPHDVAVSLEENYELLEYASINPSPLN